MTEPLQLPQQEHYRWMAPVHVPDLIRLGKDWDGGYIISASSVDTATGMLSFGINDDWSFDQQWSLRKPKDRIHGYDGTISPGRMPPDMQQSYRDFFGDKATHFPVNIGEITYIGQSSLADAWQRLNRDQVFLKMDIEGGEWQMTNAIMAHADHITGMVIEFHNTHRLRELLIATLQTYLQKFHIVHIHPNTSVGYTDNDNFPIVIEYSFLNRQLWTGTQQRWDAWLPALDQPNLPDTQDWRMFWT